jgi:hypothetical protein
MRALSLLPLAIVVVASGCGSGPEETGHAPGVPTRDLTLQRVPAPDVEVVSAVEVPRPQPERIRMHRPHRTSPPALAPSTRSAPPDASPVAEEVAAPARAVVPASAPRPAPEAAADPRVLEPGHTVTVIPVSSGPSVGSDPAEAPPSRAGRAIMMGGHGGTCQPRGALR